MAAFCLIFCLAPYSTWSKSQILAEAYRALHVLQKHLSQPLYSHSIFILCPTTWHSAQATLASLWCLCWENGCLSAFAYAVFLASYSLPRVILMALCLSFFKTFLRCRFPSKTILNTLNVKLQTSSTPDELDSIFSPF